MLKLARLALLAGIMPVTALAAVEHPLNADIYREYLRYRGTPNTTNEAPFGEVAVGTPALLQDMLHDVHSPYSEIQPAPRFANTIAWPDFVDGLAGQPTHHDVLQTMQWQLGLTKARPGIDIDVGPADERAYKGKEAAANALKAGISAQVFTTALDRHYPRLTIAAKEAVAVQLLGEQMATTPPDQWDAMAIRPSLFKRYVAGGKSLPDISEDDSQYLASLLSMALSTGDMSMHDGVQQLPAAFRVARATAAYRDATGYIDDRARCHGNAPAPGLPHSREALSEDGRLCIIAATDRGVLGWYRYEVRREHALLRQLAEQPRHRDKTGLLTMLGILLPLMDLAALVEFAEASVAGEIADASGTAETQAEAEAAATRSSSLTCGVRAA